MSIPTPVKFGIAALSLAGAALAPTAASAQTQATAMQDGKWQFSASIYGYLPTIGGSTTFPGLPGNPSPSLSIDAGNDHRQPENGLHGLARHPQRPMGPVERCLVPESWQLEVRHARFFTDQRQHLQPASANLSLDVKGTVWTDRWRVPARTTVDPAWTNDLLFGARMFDMTNTLGYSFSGTVGSHPLAGRSGSVDVSKTSGTALSASRAGTHSARTASGSCPTTSTSARAVAI